MPLLIERVLAALSAVFFFSHGPFVLQLCTTLACCVALNLNNWITFNQVNTGFYPFYSQTH